MNIKIDFNLFNLKFVLPVLYCFHFSLKYCPIMIILDVLERLYHPCIGNFLKAATDFSNDSLSSRDIVFGAMITILSQSSMLVNKCSNKVLKIRHNYNNGPLLSSLLICQILWKSINYFSVDLGFVSYGHDKIVLVDLLSTKGAPDPSYLFLGTCLFGPSIRI